MSSFYWLNSNSIGLYQILVLIFWKSNYSLSLQLEFELILNWLVTSEGTKRAFKVAEKGNGNKMQKHEN